MNRILTEIISHKKEEVRRLREQGLPITERNPLFPLRDFRAAISRPGRVGLIGEIKFSSPSAGNIAQQCDPLPIAEQYEKAGVSAISVLTDRKFFMGDLGYLMRLKEKTVVPLLRKDFILDEIQVMESFFCGADAVLLIVRILTEEALSALLALTRELGMAALVEVHDRGDLETALRCGASIIGINNRDLDIFKVDLRTTIDLAPLVPGECTLVSESGVESAEHMRILRQANIHAVLVGTSIMKSGDAGRKIGELLEAGVSKAVSGQ